MATPADPTECRGCGSTLKDREGYVKANGISDALLTLTTCPHCGGDKCCMCDMGNDVGCIKCDNEGEGE